MTIAYCIDGLWQSGGTERVVTTKLNWWATQPGVRVVCVTLDDSREPFFSLDSRVENFKLRVLPGDRRSYKTEISKLFNRLKPDIVVGVAGTAIDVLPLLNDGSRKVLEFHYTKNFLVNFVKGLHSIRFRSLHILKMKWLQWKLEKISRKYDLFVGLTKKDMNLWGNPANMTFVHNPLSFRSNIKSDCMSKRIIAVGSWTPSKGFDQLLEAFGPLSKKYPDWSVELYGSGQEEYLLREIIDKYDMKAQVSLNAPCRDIAGKLIQASIYAFPSRSDGFGLVITEAMECGLPTVAMDCPCGPCEIVTDRTGIVVPDQDINAFSRAMERLMTDGSLRQQMGKAAQTEVARFYPENIMPQWLSMFSSMIKTD